MKSVLSIKSSVRFAMAGARFRASLKMAMLAAKTELQVHRLGRFLFRRPYWLPSRAKSRLDSAALRLMGFRLGGL